MECVREIIDPSELKGIIGIPEEMTKAKVEVIVLPAKLAGHSNHQNQQINAMNELSNLFSDQDKEELKKFDQALQKRLKLGEKEVEL